MIGAGSSTLTALPVSRQTSTGRDSKYVGLTGSTTASTTSAGSTSAALPLPPVPAGALVAPIAQFKGEEIWVGDSSRLNPIKMKRCRISLPAAAIGADSYTLGTTRSSLTLPRRLTTFDHSY